MKSIAFLLFFFGVISITIGYMNAMNNINNSYTKIEYRYLPRNTYISQIEEGNNVQQLFDSMFNKSAPLEN
jgi:hypothetical protein